MHTIDSQNMRNQSATMNIHNTSDSRQPSERIDKRQGVLLINLGTPDAPETAPVRRYLRQFLSDPRVMDISPLGRFFLLNFIILPRRPKESAEAYRLVWTDKGSPILVHGQELTRLTQEKLEKQNPGKFVVKLAMRYGNPSIEKTLAEFAAEGIDRIRVLNLFPQYASATIGSAMQEVNRVANKYWNMPSIESLPPFYDHPGYLDSFAKVTSEAVTVSDYQYYLFSFHGLPECQIKKGEPSGQDRCLTNTNCCDTICAENRNCYRAQCYASARGIAKRLNLRADQWSVSFQSRLGREPWIRPYTDEIMKELAERGIKSLAVLSPAFVADCLETLEELGIRGKEDFINAGGERFVMIPSLNVHPDWVNTVASLISNREDQPIAATAPTPKGHNSMNAVNEVSSNRFEPAVSRKTLVLIAGTFWMIGGLAVLTRAYMMLSPISQTTLSEAGLLFLGLAIGSLKSHFVLSKVAGKNIDRIKNLSPHKEKICIFAFQLPLSYILVALMIATGVALRSYFGTSIYLSAAYVGIGAALIVSGMQYFMRAGTVPTNGGKNQQI